MNQNTRAQVQQIQALRADALQMYEANMPIEDIASELGVSVSTIYRYLKDLAVGNEPDGWEEAIKFTGEIVRDYLEGVQIAEISRRYNVQRYAVEKILSIENVLNSPERQARLQERRAVSDKVIIDAYQSGMRVLEISSQHNISQAYIYVVLTRNGIKPSRKRSYRFS